MCVSLNNDYVLKEQIEITTKPQYYLAHPQGRELYVYLMLKVEGQKNGLGK